MPRLMPAEAGEKIARHRLSEEGICQVCPEMVYYLILRYGDDANEDKTN